MTATKQRSKPVAVKKAPVRAPLAQNRKATPINSVTSKTMVVTPKLAEEWLGRNSHNRPIRQRAVDDIAAAITRGEWILNGDSIRFSVNNVLLDGQHRLWAIVLAETPVQTLVVNGLPEDAQETMDVGARRSLKDALSLRGYANSSKLSAALNYLWRYQNGYVRFAAAKPTIAQAIATLESNPSFIDWVMTSDRARHRFRLSTSMLSTAMYELDGIDNDAAMVFFDKFVEGANLDAHDPILVLRKHFERQAVSAVGARSSSAMSHALIIKAWNAWREGRQVETLQWRTAGTNAEQFPTPL